jgi:Mrp family chromosome partitioning ATPase/capsular polysaccharide biosynthesis protein
MPDGTHTQVAEATMLAAIWRFRWLVLLMVILGGALGGVYAMLQPARFEATASLIVQDPRASSVFETASGQQPGRFIADQVAILESTVVAERAAQYAAESGVTLSADALLEDGRTLYYDDSDLIEIRFEADTPETAVSGANLIAASYQAIRRESAAQNYASALQQLDSSIEGVGDRLVALGEEIAAQLAPNPAREELNQQLDDALVRLAELQQTLTEGSATVDPEATAATRAALDDLLRQFQTLQVIAGLDESDPEVTALLEQQQEAIARQSALIQRRDELKVDAELESIGIVVFIPALEAEEKGSPLARSLPVGLILGGLLGAAAAYYLALRHHRFTNRFQPGPILGAPFLGEVPEFGDEGIRKELPVQAVPTSASAEAFRFVAASLDVVLGRTNPRVPAVGSQPEPARPVRSLVVVSGRPGDGKSVVAANTALASARQGNRVLVIDADFGNQRLAALLSPAQNAPGLTELVEQGRPLEAVVQTLDLSGGVTLDLLPRGLLVVTAPEFFGSPAAQAFFRAVRDQYDLVLIDAPPLLQVAYASTIVRCADRALVVIRHGGDVAVAEEIAERLALLGAEAAGFVYNRAPLRDAMTSSEGSLKDVLGRGPQQPRRRAP